MDTAIFNSLSRNMREARNRVSKARLAVDAAQSELVDASREEEFAISAWQTFVNSEAAKA